jgi:RHS repeat-associated protein
MATKAFCRKEKENIFLPSLLSDVQCPASAFSDFMHFRYYASTMGRFLKPDNIIPNPANPQSWNLYSYVNGNPVNFNDPGGHFINPPHSADFSYIGLGFSPHFLATPYEAYGHFRELTSSLGSASPAAASFFAGLDISANQLNAAVGGIMSAAGIGSSDPRYQEYRNWVSDCLIYGVFNLPAFEALKTLNAMSKAYGIELGFFISRTKSGNISVVVVFGSQTSISVNLMYLTNKERQIFSKQIGFSMNSLLYFGHTHPPAGTPLGNNQESVFGVSGADIEGYRWIIEKNKIGGSAMGLILQESGNLLGIMQIGFPSDIEAFRRIFFVGP